MDPIGEGTQILDLLAAVNSRRIVPMRNGLLTSVGAKSTHWICNNINKLYERQIKGKTNERNGGDGAAARLQG